MAISQKVRRTSTQLLFQPTLSKDALSRRDPKLSLIFQSLQNLLEIEHTTERNKSPKESAFVKPRLNNPW